MKYDELDSFEFGQENPPKPFDKIIGIDFGYVIPKVLKRYTPEQTVHAKYCTQSDDCADDHCRCVDVVKGAQVSFVGSAKQLAAMIA